MRKNLFIAFEGIDGSGKSTQVKLLTEKLEAAGQKVFATCEPTNSSIGRQIRSVFNHSMEADDRVVAGLFVADRLDHLLNTRDGILKKLEEGFTVITDRYYFSSYAYQGAHMSLDWVIAANALSAELLRPDLNVYIDISPETSMERLHLGRSSMELYETLDNLKKVRKTYFEAFEKLKGRENIFITEGNRPPEEVSAEIWEEVSRISQETKIL